MDQTIWWPEFCGNATPQDAFWNPELSLNTAYPDVTRCMQQTILVWIPAAWVAISSPFYLNYLLRRDTINSCWTWSFLNAIKMVVSVLLLLSVFTNLIMVIVHHVNGQLHAPPSAFVALAIEIIVLSIVTSITRLEFKKGIHSHGVSVIFWFLLFLTDIFNLRSAILQISVYDTPVNVQDGIHYFHCFCSIFGLILQLFSDRKALGPDHFANLTGKQAVLEKVPLLDVNSCNPQEMSLRKHVNQSPELHASFLMTITHWWITRELLFGKGTHITFDELYDLRPEDKSEFITKRFKKYLDKIWKGPGRSKRTASGGDVPYPLMKVLTLTVGSSVFIGICLRLLSILLEFANSILLRVLVSWIQSEDPYTWKGIFIASFMLVNAFVSSLLLHNFYKRFWTTGMRCRSVLNALVFQKALQLSAKAKRDSTIGEIINIMSVDGQKLQDVFFTAPHVWEIPIDVVLCMLVLENTIGVSCFAGLAVIVFLVATTGVFLAYKIMRLQVRQMQAKDSRIKYLSEVLNSLKVIKLYGWEPPFVNRIYDTRERELDLVKAANVTGAITSIVNMLCPYLASLAIFAVYTQVGDGNILTAEKAFGTLAAINVIYYPVSNFPTSLFAIAQAYVSIKRTNRFLNHEECLDQSTFSDTVKPGTIKMKSANFSWEKDVPSTLKNMNLNIKMGMLVAVIGQVGSGKSSLLSAILGEMLHTGGSTKVRGTLGFAPQEPWVLQTTLRENILFGKGMKDAKYRKTLSACALERDIAQLDGGDMMEVAEKGENLSGGQKARVSLARTVYAEADLYLLDDPLSAVDAGVGKHIFNNVIGPQGMLRGKTRLFVTHAMTFLTSVDLIILMDHGEIKELGTFEELIEADSEFAAMYNNVKNSGEDDVDSLLVKSEKVRSFESEPVKGPQRLMSDEIPTTGSVPKVVVWEYIKSAGVFRVVVMVVCMILFVGSQVGTNVWLSEWSHSNTAFLYTNHTDVITYPSKRGLTGYGVLGIAQGITLAGALAAIAIGCVSASRGLHASMLSRVVRAPMSFFDTTPIGRIVNRFSKDMDIVDTNMYIYISVWLMCLAPIAAALTAISYTVPILLIFFFFMAIVFVIVMRLYMNYFRQLRRIDSVQRSPLLTHFYEALVGTTSIKAFQRQSDFINKCYQLVDESQRAWYLIIVTRRWMGVTMDTVGCLVIFFTALSVSIFREYIGASLAGMAVTYALQIIYLQNKLIRFSTELETYLTSIERIHEYTQITQEAAWKDETLSPPDIWPCRGAIEFVNYSTRYREGLDLVLTDVNLDINPGVKVGVVGRTGAGKSSLLLSLFRIIEPVKGNIVVDGLQITCLGLHDVRSRFAIIPQVPAIFTGTLRMNLDPYNQYDDENIWAALEAVNIKEQVLAWASGLGLEIGETGHNLSLGQRQLVCLARVLLRKPKVIVLDEATAAVDMETDKFIQRAIRKQFPDCTVITIAHRISTVIDYDKILVMDEGKICEFDSPEILLQNPESKFHQMARQAGIVAGIEIQEPVPKSL